MCPSWGPLRFELSARVRTDAEAEALLEKPTGKLWLTGDLHTNPGVLGMGRCLRHEANGDLVRWAMDFSHPSSSLAAAAPGAPKPGKDYISFSTVLTHDRGSGLGVHTSQPVKQISSP